VPPPQMVANMRVGNMDGFCVGEPWNHRAIMDGIGITANTTQDIWKDHPEKVLGTTGEFAQKNPNTCRAVMMAILEASRWIDASLQNKTKMAETVAQKSYINTSVDAINQRILGRYQNGLGKTWDDPNHMKFFNDGAVNFPYLSDGMWFLTQHKRCSRPIPTIWPWPGRSTASTSTSRRQASSRSACPRMCCAPAS